MKIDMANEVIDAGRFDMQTSMEERKQTLEALLQVWSFMSSQTWVLCTAITDLLTVYSNQMADKDMSQLTSSAAAYAQPMHQLQAPPLLKFTSWCGHIHHHQQCSLACHGWQS